MRKFLMILAIFSVLCISAQTEENTLRTSQEDLMPNPIEMIMSESEGNIIIDIPESLLPSILQNVGVSKSSNPSPRKTNTLKSGVNRLNGYRVQVFMDGRNQSTLESRAKARGNLILSKFPKYRGQIYTYSNSPNWYCRVGNFKTSEEAKNALSELKKAFPNYSGEMRVVKSPIVIIKE